MARRFWQARLAAVAVAMLGFACARAQNGIEPQRLLELEGSVLAAADSTPVRRAEVVLFQFGGDRPPVVIAATRADSGGSFWLRVRVDARSCDRLEILARALGYDHGMARPPQFNCEEACQRLDFRLKPPHATAHSWSAPVVGRCRTG